MPTDLFANAKAVEKAAEYTAKDIEVLEGLEPVRKRPGMYIGGTDEAAMHHLVSEVFDNCMDEAVAGYANRIEMDLHGDGSITIRDNGRGIPTDPHPKYPKKSALEVILTTLHSGGKFSNKAYETSGGLHGVGISVVNALASELTVEVARDRQVWAQHFSQGKPTSQLEKIGETANRRGTSIWFKPDAEIFGTGKKFKPKRLFKFAQSKAYLYKGVEIRWACDPSLLKEGDDTIPEKTTLHYEEGLKEFLTQELHGEKCVTPEPFAGEVKLAEGQGRVEWAVHWPLLADGFAHSYCNTVPTPLGGTHETGLRAALYKGLREYGEMIENKKAKQITGEDVFSSACVILSLFYKSPEFQGQTKDKLVSNQVTKLVENAVRDQFDHWLSSNPEASNALMTHIIERVDERLRRRQKKEVSRKSITQKLRLPGKLADCSQEDAEGTEIFLVEGDSAGGSAKQARNRATQAILPLRGKILNVASATRDKIAANQEIKDMLMALGCGTGSDYREEDLRYEKIIIMCDADVDGAHIASLLMTFFYKEMPKLIENGHLYLAQPPLYRITQGAKSYYAADAGELEQIVEKLKKNKGKIETGRFKGLGEMTPPQLKETTMDPTKRTLCKVVITDDGWGLAKQRVIELMGKHPELRFKFIQDQSSIYGERIAEALDI